MASGAVFGLPLVLIAAVIARPFATAATRYRIYVAAFLAAATFAPLALLASYLRPASPASGLIFEHTVVRYAPLPLIALCIVIAALLLGDLAIDLFKLLRIKAFSRIVGAIPRQHREAAVAASAHVRTPTAIGYLHPRIVVPLDLPERVSAEELRAIVAHENAHLERYDDWTKAAQTAIVRLLWFAPALWALAARLDLERELASDERVLARAFDPRAYAACLVRLAADVRCPHAAPAAWVTRSQVAVRVERLLKPGTRLAWYVGVSRVALLVVAIGASALGALAVVPSAMEYAPVAHHDATIRAPHQIAARPRHAHLRVMPQHHTTVAVNDVLRSTAPRAHVSAPEAKPAMPEVIALALVPPCRTCMLLRRPVLDGPGRAHHFRGLRPMSDGSDLTGPDDGSGRYGYPWDQDVMRAITPYEMFVPISPPVH